MTGQFQSIIMYRVLELLTSKAIVMKNFSSTFLLLVMLKFRECLLQEKKVERILPKSDYSRIGQLYVLYVIFLGGFLRGYGKSYY